MNASSLRICAAAALATCALYADIVIYNNGDHDEGFIETNATTMRIADKARINTAEFPLSMISNIEIGTWLTAHPTSTATMAQSSNATAHVNTVAEAASPNDEPPSMAAMEKIFPGISNVTFKKLFTFQNISVIVWIVGAMVFSLVSFIMVIVLIVDAFQNSMLWGFLCLCCGLAQLIYLFTQYSGNKLKMTFWLFFPIIWALIGKYLVIKPFLDKLAQSQ